ncbi:putative serine/threonine protein kinase [Blattamonas nauphoetae]|uniref:non-specific serine/threonine protein kinase n=1 Tax=Blattamonas nauphoetae TaxID=2049346 RepID=A0ABQ9XX40_9EUKA|nr:putative serine/threonine protein kinase [Blattamonas nauphoetae]
MSYAGQKTENYHILQLVGEGSFGKVYKGRRKSTGQVVAMKFISKVGKTKKDLRNLQLEIDIMQRLHHDNICMLLDTFETDTDIVMVIEFGEGDLFEILEDDKTLPEAEVQKIAKQLISALYYLHHNKIIHRDLKPQNILIFSDGSIKVADFGFARTLSRSSVCLTSMKGTPLYMPPELVMEKPYDKSADLWSMGIVLYELFVGVPPFYTNNFVSLVRLIVQDPVKYPSNMSDTFKSFLRGLLQKKPDKRLTWPNLAQHPFVKESRTERELRKLRPTPEMVHLHFLHPDQVPSSDLIWRQQKLGVNLTHLFPFESDIVNKNLDKSEKEKIVKAEKDNADFIKRKKDIEETLRLQQEWRERIRKGQDLDQFSGNSEHKKKSLEAKEKRKEEKRAQKEERQRQREIDRRVRHEEEEKQRQAEEKRREEEEKRQLEEQKKRDEEERRRKDDEQKERDRERKEAEAKQKKEDELRRKREDEARKKADEEEQLRKAAAKTPTPKPAIDKAANSKAEQLVRTLLSSSFGVDLPPGSILLPTSLSTAAVLQLPKIHVASNRGTQFEPTIQTQIVSTITEISDNIFNLTTRTETMDYSQVFHHSTLLSALLFHTNSSMIISSDPSSALASSPFLTTGFTVPSPFFVQLPLPSSSQMSPNVPMPFWLSERWGVQKWTRMDKFRDAVPQLFARTFSHLPVSSSADSAMLVTHLITQASLLQATALTISAFTATTIGSFWNSQLHLNTPYQSQSPKDGETTPFVLWSNNEMDGQISSFTTILTTFFESFFLGSSDGSQIFGWSDVSSVLPVGISVDDKKQGSDKIEVISSCLLFLQWLINTVLSLQYYAILSPKGIMEFYNAVFSTQHKIEGESLSLFEWMTGMLLVRLDSLISSIASIEEPSEAQRLALISAQTVLSSVVHLSSSLFSPPLPHLGHLCSTQVSSTPIVVSSAAASSASHSALTRSLMVAQSSSTKHSTLKVVGRNQGGGKQATLQLTTRQEMEGKAVAEFYTYLPNFLTHHLKKALRPTVKTTFATGDSFDCPQLVRSVLNTLRSCLLSVSSSSAQSEQTLSLLIDSLSLLLFAIHDSTENPVLRDIIVLSLLSPISAANSSPTPKYLSTLLSDQNASLSFSTALPSALTSSSSQQESVVYIQRLVTSICDEPQLLNKPTILYVFDSLRVLLKSLNNTITSPPNQSSNLPSALLLARACSELMGFTAEALSIDSPSSQNVTLLRRILLSEANKLCSFGDISSMLGSIFSALSSNSSSTARSSAISAFVPLDLTSALIPPISSQNPFTPHSTVSITPLPIPTQLLNTYQSDRMSAPNSEKQFDDYGSTFPGSQERVVSFISSVASHHGSAMIAGLFSAFFALMETLCTKHSSVLVWAIPTTVFHSISHNSVLSSSFPSSSTLCSHLDIFLWITFLFNSSETVNVSHTSHPVLFSSYLPNSNLLSTGAPSKAAQSVISTLSAAILRPTHSSPVNSSDFHSLDNLAFPAQFPLTPELFISSLLVSGLWDSVLSLLSRANHNLISPFDAKSLQTDNFPQSTHISFSQVFPLPFCNCEEVLTEDTLESLSKLIYNAVSLSASIPQSRLPLSASSLTPQPNSSHKVDDFSVFLLIRQKGEMVGTLSPFIAPSKSSDVKIHSYVKTILSALSILFTIDVVSTSSVTPTPGHSDSATVIRNLTHTLLQEKLVQRSIELFLPSLTKAFDQTDVSLKRMLNGRETDSEPLCDPDTLDLADSVTSFVLSCINRLQLFVPQIFVESRMEPPSKPNLTLSGVGWLLRLIQVVSLHSLASLSASHNKPPLRVSRLPSSLLSDMAVQSPAAQQKTTDELADEDDLLSTHGRRSPPDPHFLDLDAIFAGGLDPSFTFVPQHSCLIDSILILAHIARLDKRHYPELLNQSRLLFSLFPVLLSFPSDSVNSKTCNLLGNLFRHDATFYRPILTHPHIIRFISRECLFSRDPQTRKFACFAIGNAGFHTDELYDQLNESITGLVRCLEDEDDPKTSANAAGALGNLVRHSDILVKEMITTGGVAKLVGIASLGWVYGKSVKLRWKKEVGEEDELLEDKNTIEGPTIIQDNTPSPFEASMDSGELANQTISIRRISLFSLANIASHPISHSYLQHMLNIDSIVRELKEKEQDPKMKTYLTRFEQRYVTSLGAGGRSNKTGITLPILDKQQFSQPATSRRADSQKSSKSNSPSHKAATDRGGRDISSALMITPSSHKQFSSPGSRLSASPSRPTSMSDRQRSATQRREWKDEREATQQVALPPPLPPSSAYSSSQSSPSSLRSLPSATTRLNSRGTSSQASRTPPSSITTTSAVPNVRRAKSTGPMRGLTRNSPLKSHPSSSSHSTISAQTKRPSSPNRTPSKTSSTMGGDRWKVGLGGKH